MMKRVWDNIVYRFLYVVWYTWSLLPLGVLYACGRVLYVLLAYVIGYRKAVIDKNLRNAFPDKSDDERRKLRLEFYAFFCDYIAETIKFATMSREEIARRMEAAGVDALAGRTTTAYWPETSITGLTSSFSSALWITT